MENLDFFVVNSAYAAYLQNAESAVRGFSRVPNMDYGDSRKQKFLCGVVLKINDVDYYVPVTSYKIKKPDNFLICADNGSVVSSLRFNYMFPVPADAITRRIIDTESDVKYKALLSQELRYCIKNQDEIRHLAERTYKRVLLGKDPGLVINSCDFKLLELKCNEWIEKYFN